MQSAGETPSLKYSHSPDMGEISGFGGGYEATCQRMLNAAVTWLLETKPDADPQFQGFKNVYGVLLDDNDDAKALSRIACDAATNNGKNPEESATGAMHQAVISRALFVKKNGWDAYCAKLRKSES